MLDKEQQNIENRRMVADAKMEALDMYFQYLKGHIILVPKPQRCFINVYDESTCLSYEDYNKIRSEEFKRLRMENEDKKGDFPFNIKFDGNYFTPHIDDIYVGYELEVYTPTGWKSGKFPEVLNENPELNEFKEDSIMKLAHAIIRTPYLTKEQIEKEEGIEFHKEISYWHSNTIHGCAFRKNNNWIILKYKADVPLISIVPIDPVKEEDFWHEVRFIGYCKSINEFRKVLKLLNI